MVVHLRWMSQREKVLKSPQIIKKLRRLPFPRTNGPVLDVNVKIFPGKRWAELVLYIHSGSVLR